MKHLFPTLVLALTLFSTACKSTVVLDGKTYDYVGYFADEDRVANLHYRANTRNILVGAVFFQMVAPPVVVVLNEFYCPDYVKPKIISHL